MAVIDLMRSTNACRYYKPDPVASTLIAQVVDAARWAPSGGNRQPLRVIVVRSPEKKMALRDLYLPGWNGYVAGIRAGSVQLGAAQKILEAADHFARHMHEIPVMLVVCARLADVHPTDNQLGRLSIVGGASVYPAVQNMIIAAREAGLGSALTTLHCAVEPALKPLLGIPEDVSVAAVVTLGWPVKPFPTKLTRRPLVEMTFDETFGTPFAAAAEVV